MNKGNDFLTTFLGGLVFFFFVFTLIALIFYENQAGIFNKIIKKD